jgi:hypothetical protein
MKKMLAAFWLIVAQLSPALAQPPPPPPPSEIVVCPKFYWGEWGGIHYYTASTCWTDQGQCTEGDETEAQSFRIHTTQPNCCPVCNDPIFSPSPTPPPPMPCGLLLQEAKKIKYHHRKTKGTKEFLMREKNNQKDYMKLRGNAKPGETEDDPDREYSFNKNVASIEVVLDTVVEVTNSQDGKPKYFRVLLLQAVFPGETATRKLAIGQQVEKKVGLKTSEAEFVDDPDGQFFADVKAKDLGETIYQVEAHEKLKKKT